MAIKLFFVPEAGEKPISVYHQLKLHPYGPDAEKQRELGREGKGGEVVSRCYEEVVFNEPAEAFYDVLTIGAVSMQGARGKGKGAKAALSRKGERTAEIPYEETDSSPYSLRMEGRELDLLKEAVKQVEVMAGQERMKLAERERLLGELRKEAAGKVVP